MEVGKLTIGLGNCKIGSRKMKGPKDGVMQAYYVSPTCSENFRNLGTGVLLLSIGQEYSEDEKLLAQIELVNNTLSKCIVVPADTLQRHTFSLSNPTLSPEELYEAAYEQGQEWRERNRFILQELTVPHKIITWNEWLAHKDYIKYRSLVDSVFKSDSKFRQAYIQTAEIYCNRHLRRLNTILGIEEREKIMKNCIEYLKEEAAVIMPIWAKEGYNYTLYAGEISDALQATYEHFVKPYYQCGTCTWIPVKFKRYSKIFRNVSKLSNFNFERGVNAVPAII